VLLLSEQGWDRESIAAATGSSTSTVGRVRRRFCEEGLQAALCERPRPGGQAKLSSRQEQELVALACTDPPTGFARWSVRLLRKEAIRKGVVPKVGRELIRLVLHEHGIKPWREKNVVHSLP
jgi:transposase